MLQKPCVTSHFILSLGRWQPYINSRLRWYLSSRSSQSQNYIILDGNICQWNRTAQLSSTDVKYPKKKEQERLIGWMYTLREIQALEKARWLKKENMGEGKSPTPKPAQPISAICVSSCSACYRIGCNPGTKISTHWWGSSLGKTLNNGGKTLKQLFQKIFILFRISGRDIFLQKNK